MRIKNYKSDIEEFRAHKNQVTQNLKIKMLTVEVNIAFTLSVVSFNCQ